jgi:lipopolysaccharide transport system ATP-binding protein
VVNEPIGVPICGVVVSNDRGIIVHGKNSWQYDDDVPRLTTSAVRLVCHQEIMLSLGPGEYTYEVGLAAVSVKDWTHRQSISHEEFSLRHERLCHVSNAGSFSVGMALRGHVAVLTHHGVADLPGKIRMDICTIGEADANE